MLYVIIIYCVEFTKKEYKPTDNCMRVCVHVCNVNVQCVYIFLCSMCLCVLSSVYGVVCMCKVSYTSNCLLDKFSTR